MVNIFNILLILNHICFDTTLDRIFIFTIILLLTSFTKTTILWTNGVTIDRVVPVNNLILNVLCFSDFHME